MLPDVFAPENKKIQIYIYGEEEHCGGRGGLCFFLMISIDIGAKFLII
jgi:hypothetical protein